jgi:outer membrane receptor protein involved in Fe transport
VLAAALACIAARAEDPPAPVELGRVEVLATTPLPGLGVPLAAVPANVQAFSAPQRTLGATLPSFLDDRAAGVAVASGQGNPFQPDLAYRGFVASPLLGTPQGVSVFQDGVRLNEPFGDVVNWDLLPASAIASAQLIPGTTPMFGPNALGGILALQTKSGARFPGGALELGGGSHGRRALEVEQGGRDGAWDHFVTANVLRDDGWARQNASRIRQVFARGGYQGEHGEAALTLTTADNVLHGTQALPLAFMDDIRQPYTYPDRTANRMRLLALQASHPLAEGVLLGATAYARRLRSESLASNVGDESEAVNDLGVIEQRGHGMGAQLTVAGQAWGRDNQLVAGASGDYGTARFTRESQPARFSVSRESVGIGPFAPDTDAASGSDRYGVFVADSLSAAEGWVVTVSGRYDVSRVRIADRSGGQPLLDGRHRFARLNPGLGATYTASPRVTAYAAYGESMRAPTAMELTCADPAAPCRLPNAFLADPPLQLVVARTVEAGARGKWGEGGAWSAAAYRTLVGNDIQFVSSDGAAASAGYFRNVGATRRQGVELAVSTAWAGLGLSLRYARVDATFRDEFRASSPANSSADGSGSILVTPGSRIPGIPRDTLRLGIERSADAFSFGVALACNGPVHARGDENNRDAGGRVPGYAVVNASAAWRPAAGLEIGMRVENALDKRYARSGVVGTNFFNGPGRTYDPAGAAPEQFRGPGAPLGLWLGIRYRWT